MEHPHKKHYVDKPSTACASPITDALEHPSPTRNQANLVNASNFQNIVQAIGVAQTHDATTPICIQEPMMIMP